MSLGWIDDYELLRELGKGGMGQVYVARHRELDREVALKRLGDADVGDPQLTARLLREAQAVAKLRHPNLVTVHAVGEHAGAPYFVMDLVEGRPLSDRLREGPLSGADAAASALALAAALAHAHEQGIVHRDLKPDNVLIKPDGQPVLVDFGLARELSERREALTRTGELAGTPAYMSPEQARGDREAIGPWTDVYGLGATLYAMLTGSAPFSGASVLGVLAAVSEDPPLAPSRLASVDPSLEAICMRCLAKRPDARYPSMQALAADLRRRAEGEALEADRRGGARLGAAALVVVLAVVAVALMAFPAPRPSPADAPPSGVGSSVTPAEPTPPGPGDVTPAEPTPPGPDDEPRSPGHAIGFAPRTLIPHGSCRAARFVAAGVLTVGQGGVKVSSEQGGVRSWPLRERRVIESLALFPSHRRMVVGGNDWAEVHPLGGEGQSVVLGVTPAADPLDPDEAVIYRLQTWGDDRVIALQKAHLQVFDLSQPEAPVLLERRRFKVARFTADGDLLTVGGQLLSVRRWGTWEERTWPLEGLDRPPCLEPDPLGVWLIGGVSGRVMTLDAEFRPGTSLDGGIPPNELFMPAGTVRAHDGTVRGIARLRGGGLVTVSSHDVALWDPAGELLQRSPRLELPLTHWDLDVSQDGALFLTTVKDSGAQVWTLSR